MDIATRYALAAIVRGAAKTVGDQHAILNQMEDAAVALTAKHHSADAADLRKIMELVFEGWDAPVR